MMRKVVQKLASRLLPHSVSSQFAPTSVPIISTREKTNLVSFSTIFLVTKVTNLSVKVDGNDNCYIQKHG